MEIFGFRFGLSVNPPVHVWGYIHIVGWVGRVYGDFLFSVRIVGEPARTCLGLYSYCRLGVKSAWVLA